MKKNQKKNPRFPDYERVKLEMEDIITFGTSVFIRKDKKALKIVFPTGSILTFAPEDEPDNYKGGKLIHSLPMDI